MNANGECITIDDSSDDDRPNDRGAGKRSAPAAAAAAAAGGGGGGQAKRARKASPDPRDADPEAQEPWSAFLGQLPVDGFATGSFPVTLREGTLINLAINLRESAPKKKQTTKAPAAKAKAKGKAKSVPASSAAAAAAAAAAAGGGNGREENNNDNKEKEDGGVADREKEFVEACKKAIVRIEAEGRALGRVPNDVATRVAPLLSKNLLKVEARVASYTSGLQLGSNIPIKINFFIESAAFFQSAELGDGVDTPRSGGGGGGGGGDALDSVLSIYMRDCWVWLFQQVGLNCLRASVCFAATEGLGMEESGPASPKDTEPNTTTNNTTTAKNNNNNNNNKDKDKSKKDNGGGPQAMEIDMIDVDKEGQGAEGGENAGEDGGESGEDDGAKEPNDEDEDSLEETEEARQKNDAIFCEHEGAGADGKGTHSPLPRMEPPTPLFRSTLRPYQQEGLWWMARREGFKDDTDNDSQTEADMDALYEEYEFPRPSGRSSTLKSFYFNRASGELQLRFPNASQECIGGILSDEMGLGKTVQLLALVACGLDRAANAEVDEDMDGGGDGGREKGVGGTLIVVPTSILTQWRSEVEKHLCVSTASQYLPSKRAQVVYEYYGNDRTRSTAISKHLIVLTTYGTVLSEFNESRHYVDDDAPPKEQPKKPTKQERALINQPSILSFFNPKGADGPVEALASAPVSSPLFAIKWSRIILDEAQMIKEKTTKTCKACCSLKTTPNGARWCLSGTPIQNSLEDVYALMKFLRVRPWASHAWWRRLITVPLQRGQAESAIQALRLLTKSILLRRNKSSKDSDGNPLCVLPPLHEETLMLEMLPEEREVYEAMQTRAQQEFRDLMRNNALNVSSVLGLLTKLRQCTCHPSLARVAGEEGAAPEDGPLRDFISVKVATLLERLAHTTKEGKRSVVFSSFTSFLDILEGFLKKRRIPSQKLDGRTTVEQRRKCVSWFQEEQQEGSDVQGRTLLVSMRAGGTGLNMTAGEVVFLCDLWWNPATENQAISRVHRIGQTQEVNVFRLVAKETVEENILTLHAQKRNAARRVLDSSGLSGSKFKLTIEDIRMLVFSKFGGTNGPEAAGNT
ncbi:unnamed protein product [Vitrella brassicaformis CCMP3155]|uniref:Helicase C-terminal domain-containing protein n=3 Tax=Vitrella brassicaformis TaxID=1169539 RepID=A0A0G4FXD2_VITBC|nr:unnamed protein product [Vitrella brassicaformis CCMP3155]|eukprot:CEM20062.1 unnamed protein product [Vitrella brassicaformis CCMP3155]